MASFDSVRHTSGAVFSMDQLKGGDAFRLCSTPRKVSSSYAGFHQTSWSYVSNLARDRHPPLISRKHPSGGSNRSDQLRPAPHLRQRNATVSQQEGHSRPQDEQPRARLPRHQGSRLRTRKLRSTPMTCCRPRTEHKAIRATQGRATSRATRWTRHRAVCTIRGKEGTSSKGGEEKKKGYLRDYPLAGGYQFQGWHFGGERNRARFTGWQHLTRVC